MAHLAATPPCSQLFEWVAYCLKPLQRASQWTFGQGMRRGPSSGGSGGACDTAEAELLVRLAGGAVSSGLPRSVELAPAAGLLSRGAGTGSSTGAPPSRGADGGPSGDEPSGGGSKKSAATGRPSDLGWAVAADIIPELWPMRSFCTDATASQWSGGDASRGGPLGGGRGTTPRQAPREDHQQAGYPGRACHL